MRRGRRLRVDDLPVRAEVNVTSLVDIAFVLLVIFIITAPMLQGGVEVNMPRGSVKPLPSDTKPFIITLRPDGSVFLEQSRLSFPEFERAFPQLAQTGKFERVYLRADSLVTYASLIRVMGVVSQTGKPVALMAEPKELGR